MQKKRSPVTTATLRRSRQERLVLGRQMWRRGHRSPRLPCVNAVATMSSTRYNFVSCRIVLGGRGHGRASITSCCLRRLDLTYTTAAPSTIISSFTRDSRKLLEEFASPGSPVNVGSSCVHRPTMPLLSMLIMKFAVATLRNGKDSSEEQVPYGAQSRLYRLSGRASSVDMAAQALPISTIVRRKSTVLGSLLNMRESITDSQLASMAAPLGKRRTC